MPELVQGYDIATQITALADWLRRRQAQPPQRIWIATDPERIARATLLARILQHSGLSPAAPAAGWCLRSLPANGWPVGLQLLMDPRGAPRCLP